MTEPTRKNMSASVRARLLNLARSTNRDFQELTTRYAVERFLVRLALSKHKDRFILKGAMLYIAWKLDDKRTTMDLDLLGIGSPDPERLADVFRQICEVHTEDDGLLFEKDSVTAAPIREEAVYDGVRVVVRVTLGAMPIRLQVDVGFGDAVVPAARQSEFPSLLDEQGPMVKAYSPETVIAEKFNAMVLLGMANSRMKDYFDIWMLSRSFKVEGSVLRDAILNTFAKRQTALPDSLPIGLSEEFSRNESKLLQWQGFVKRQRRQEAAPTLDGVIAVVREFLLPVITSISSSVPIPATWDPSSGWQDGLDVTQTPGP